MKSPPNSPDLNPIEWLWSDLKRFVGKKFPTNMQQLKKAIDEFRKTITPKKCKKYIKRQKNFLVNIIFKFLRRMVRTSKIYGREKN